MNSLTIMIGQLGLVWVTNRKTGNKLVNILVSKRLLIFYKQIVCYFVCLHAFFNLSVGQLSKPNHDCETVHTKRRGNLVLMFLYIFIPLS